MFGRRHLTDVRLPSSIDVWPLSDTYVCQMSYTDVRMTLHTDIRPTLLAMSGWYQLVMWDKCHLAMSGDVVIQRYAEIVWQHHPDVIFGRWGDIIEWHRPDVRKDVGPMSSRSTALYWIYIRSLALYRTCPRHHLTMSPDIFWHQCDIIGWHRPDIRKSVGSMSTRSPALYRIDIRNLAYYRTCHQRHSIYYMLCGF